MKVVAITGPRAAELREVERPRIADNYVRVEVHVAPMCTESGAFRDGHVGHELGHEAAGVVTESFPGSRRKVGDRVVVMPQNGCGQCFDCLSGAHIRCQTPRDPYAITGGTTGRATFAQELIQQDWLLLAVPDDISLEHASMACCGLGPTFGAMQAMNVGPGETVLISGLGPVGLGGVVNARARGARVLGIEANLWRSDLALRLGAEAVVDPRDPDALRQIRELTDGRGVDKSIEASSAETAPALVLQATRVNGQMASTGWGGPVNMRDVVARGVTVHGIWHWNHLQDGEAMWRTIRRSGPEIDQLVTHRYPMSEVVSAWETQLSGECGKVLLDPRA